ncbi:MAG: phytanoyl-CoA dioxygenase family protein [Planctomycetales bacterium]|nr:phytanoyl-CoA dioxygenase family protein [Planctomycetales bacterium]
MHWPNDKNAIRESYDKDGFVVIRQLFDSPEVDNLRGNLERYIRDVVPHVPPMDAFFEDAKTRQQIRMLPRMEKHDAYFNELLTVGCIPGIARELNGGEVDPLDAAYFNKLPVIGDATPPHQDGFYFHLQPCEALTIWLALDDADEHNGCIHYVRGSHRRGMRNHNRTQTVGFSHGIADYGTDDDVQNEVAACVSPGDAIVHHAMTIHRADPNTSSRTRRALGFVYFSSNASVDVTARDKYQQDLASEWQADGKI